MKKVLMVGPALSVKGGMTTVVEQYLNSNLRDEFDLSYIESTNDKNVFFKILKMLIGIIKFSFLIKKNDIVHIHMASNLSTYRKLLYVRIAKKNQKKIILHIHGGGFKDFYKRCSRKKQLYIKNTINFANKIIVLSNEWYEYFSEIIEKKKMVVIYNGVKVPNDYKKSLNNKNILFLGRINKEKGIYDLISVTKSLKEKYKDVCLYICGSGEEEKINSIIKENKLNDNIKLMGWIKDSKKEEMIKECAFFCLPSYYEAMPMSILEAMSYKCVVISTFVGGIPQIIKTNKNGILLKPGDSNSLYQMFCKLFEDKELVKNISNNAKKTIEDEFDLQKNINKIKEIYLNE